MADERERPVEGSEETEAERRRRLQEELSRQIEARYSPDRLRATVVEGAGRGEALDLSTRMEMERKVGGRFDDVRVFRGPLAEAVTRRHQADAVTIADTGMILVREGPRADPRTALGKSLLAHELTHVKQAQSGMHFALEQGQSQQAPHEKEAEAVEAKVHAEETGRKARPSAPAVDPEVRRKLVMARVHELIEEAERVRRDRLGLD